MFLDPSELVLGKNGISTRETDKVGVGRLGLVVLDFGDGAVPVAFVWNGVGFTNFPRDEFCGSEALGLTMTEVHSVSSSEIVQV